MPVHEAWVLGALIMLIGLILGFNAGLWWAGRPRVWRDECPCCGDHIEPAGDDAPFCWECGLYERDPASDCDNPDHRGGRREVMPDDPGSFEARSVQPETIENVPRPGQDAERDDTRSITRPGHTYSELTALADRDELEALSEPLPPVDPDWHPKALARSEAWLADCRAELGLVAA